MDAIEQQLQDTFVAWVSERLSRVEQRPDAWCASWWAHPEAVDRLYALHQAWESARRRGTLISWWNYDWAIQWPAMTQPGGVLDGCTAFDHVSPVLPQMRFERLPDATDLQLPFQSTGDACDGNEGDEDEVERRLRAEKSAAEKALLASMGDDRD